ncbi:UNVERIFIED_CONTAM: hypothetical protein RMT77_003615 [Armadillidium vulgare]
MDMLLRRTAPIYIRARHNFFRCPRTWMMTLLMALFTLLLILVLNSRGYRGDISFIFFPDEDLTGAAQDSIELISYIRQLHVLSPTGGAYNLKNPRTKDPSQNGQGLLIANLFSHKKGGTFIEAGAYDGEDLSNTLYLEKELDWKGLLVEPDPWNFWSLRKKSRSAHAIQCCLSPFPYPREVTFRQSDTMGRIVAQEETKSKGIFTRVKCFPLYSLMKAQNLTVLDLLSLDVEGMEIQVLETLPWDKVSINAILIEVAHVSEGKSYVKSYMESKNYSLETEVGDDYLFVRK